MALDKKYFVLDDNIGYIKLLDYMGTDNTIPRVARISFDNFEANKTEEQDIRLLKRLWKDKHNSPFEMCELMFEVKCPIFVARQWFRHRTGSFNEHSGRYSQMPNEFYLPKQLYNQSQTNKQMSGEPVENIKNMHLTSIMKHHFDECFILYDKLINDGVSREMARIILPLSVYTKFIWKLNLRNLTNFLQLRLAKDSQFEIRAYANAILEIIEPIYPRVIELLKTEIKNNNE